MGCVWLAAGLCCHDLLIHVAKHCDAQQAGQNARSRYKNPESQLPGDALKARNILQQVFQSDQHAQNQDLSNARPKDQPSHGAKVALMPEDILKFPGRATDAGRAVPNMLRLSR